MYRELFDPHEIPADLRQYFEEVDAKCGKPWERDKEVQQPPPTSVGWHPACKCCGETVPCVVMDPFSGSGTTGLVALKAGRHYVGIDLSEDYLRMSMDRLSPILNQGVLEIIP